MVANEHVVVRVGLLSPSDDIRESWEEIVEATDLGSVVAVAEDYCSPGDDRILESFLEAKAEVIIVDLQDRQSGLQSLQRVRSAIPSASIFVCCESEDSALIIEVMRAGAREFLKAPVQPHALTQALKRHVAERRHVEGSKGRGEIYGVVSVRGGCGGTSLSINLAASLAELPQTKVALIDLNQPLGDIAVYLNLKPQFTILDALSSASRLDAVLLDSFMSEAAGISVLAGRRELDQQVLYDAEALTQIVEVAGDSYSHVFVDLSLTSEEMQYRTVAALATKMMVVVTPDLGSVWTGKQLLEYLSQWVEPDRIFLVLNRTKLTDEITEKEVEEAVKLPVSWKLPNNYTASLEAINSGTPLVYRNQSELARKYRDLSYKLTGTSPPRKKRRFFGLLR